MSRYLIEMLKEDELKIVELYDIKKYSLRRIGEIMNIDHHRVKRILTSYNIPLNNTDRAITSRKGYKKKPFTEEHRRNIGLSSKGRTINKGKKMPKIALYKNMVTHLHRDIPIEFFLLFDDIDRLKCLTSLINRDRVKKYFNDEQYKNFITHFYYNDTFNKTYNDWLNENKQQFAKPSLDHKIPLSKGGTWDLDNLQIIPWCINRAKYNFMPDEWEYIKIKYLSKEGDFND